MLDANIVRRPEMSEDDRPPVVMAWAFMLSVSVLGIAAIALTAEIGILATRLACRAVGYVAR